MLHSCATNEKAHTDPSDEAVAFAKLVAALVEHSSEWLVAHIQESQVQTFLAMVLRITGWKGIAGVEENISEVSSCRDCFHRMNSSATVISAYTPNLFFTARGPHGFGSVPGSA